MTKAISLRIAVIAIFILFFGGVVAIAQASNSWSKYHWDISTAESEISPLKLGNNLSAVWKVSLDGASADWNQSVLKNQIVGGTSNANCDPTLGQVEVCNSTYGNNNWLGIAQVWVYRGKDGHIGQGTVKLNDTYFNTPAYDTQAWRDLVTCQEVGHTFGLGHQDENFSNPNLGTCMDYTDDPDGSIYGQFSNEHPDQHDLDELADKYAHLNSTATGGDGGGKPDKGNNGNGGGKKNKGSVGADIDVSDPSAWGQAIRQDAQGNNSLFTRNLGNGFELITHVLWVPGYVSDHE